MDEEISTSTSTVTPTTSPEVAPVEQETAQTTEPKEGTWRDARGRFIASAAPSGQAKAPPEQGTEAAPTPEETQAEEVKQDEKYGPKFAALARAHAKAKEREETLRREQAAWRKERETLSFFRETAPKDPLGALRKMADYAGVPFSQLFSAATRELMKEGQPPDPAEVARQAAQEQLEAWKAEQARAQQEAQQREEQSRIQRELEQGLGELGRLLGSGAYPRCLVPLKGQTPQERIEQVQQVALHEMAREYAATGRILDFEDALVRIEEGLEAHFQGQLEALRGTAPQTSTYGGVTPVAAKAAPGDGRTPTGHQETARPRTLAQRLATEGGPPKPLGWKERRERFARGG